MFANAQKTRQIPSFCLVYRKHLPSHSVGSEALTLKGQARSCMKSFSIVCTALNLWYERKVPIPCPPCLQDDISPPPMACMLQVQIKRSAPLAVNRLTHSYNLCLLLRVSSVQPPNTFPPCPEVGFFSLCMIYNGNEEFAVAAILCF